MSKYTKEIDGVKVVKTLQEIVVTVGDMSTYNPTEEMVLNDGWEKVESLNNDADKLSKAKESKIKEIKNYDSSQNVNEFFLNEISLWVDKETRIGLKFRFEVEISAEKIDTVIWYNGVQFNLRLEDAMDILYRVEKYASECYDNTQRHISTVNMLKTVEEVNEYDYKIGYPEKLYFNK